MVSWPRPNYRITEGQKEDIRVMGTFHGTAPPSYSHAFNWARFIFQRLAKEGGEVLGVYETYIVPKSRSRAKK